MTENQKDVAAERDQLRAENEALKAQLASVAAGAPAGQAAAPQHTFQLSQAGLNDLELYGVTNVAGKLYTRDMALKAMAAAGQKGVSIKEAPDGTRNQAGIDAANRADGRAGIAGLDYIPVDGVDQGPVDRDETDR